MTENYKRMSSEDWEREYIPRFAGLSDKELRKDLRELIVQHIGYHPDFATRGLIECLYDEIKNGFFKEIKNLEYARGYEDGRQATVQDRRGLMGSDCGMDRNEVGGNTAYFTDGYCDGYCDGYGAGYYAADREEASNPECPDETAAGEYKKGWTKGYKEGYRDRLDAVVVPMSSDEDEDDDMLGV